MKEQEIQILKTEKAQNSLLKISSMDFVAATDELR